MCGRFTLWVNLGDLIQAFPEFEFPDELEARYNIAPTQSVAAVPNTEGREVTFFRWGLVPFWAKDPAMGNRMINARSETAAQKPSFRAAYRSRRCLVLADGFYEWRKEPGSLTKTPMYIQLADGSPFAFAGLWETWRPQDQPADSADVLRTCTILTTQPNDLVAPIHNRMPVILPASAYDRWLEPAQVASGALDDLLGPYPAEAMTAYEVSRQVNNPKNDTPVCVAPIQ